MLVCSERTWNKLIFFFLTDKSAKNLTEFDRTPNSFSPWCCFKTMTNTVKGLFSVPAVCFKWKWKNWSYVSRPENTNKRPHSQPAELSLAPSFSFSHVFIRNSALSASVSVAVAAGYKTCMENLLVEISQHLTAWLAAPRWLDLAFGLHRNLPQNGETKKLIECNHNFKKKCSHSLTLKLKKQKKTFTHCFSCTQGCCSLSQSWNQLWRYKACQYFLSVKEIKKKNSCRKST